MIRETSCSFAATRLILVAVRHGTRILWKPCRKRFLSLVVCDRSFKKLLETAESMSLKLYVVISKIYDVVNSKLPKENVHEGTKNLSEGFRLLFLF